MRHLVPFIAAALAGSAASVSLAGDVHFGLEINGPVVPGVYGHVVIGNAPPPPVVYARPMVIEPPPPGLVVRPIYLHVPPEYARHWRLHCHEYHACNRPVYFVRSPEYEPGFNMERWRREHPQWRGHEEREHFDHERFDRDHHDGDHHDRDHYDRGHYDRDHHDHDRGHHDDQDR